MKTTKSPFMIKASHNDQPNKIHFNRNQSLQIDRGSRESLDKQIKENYLSSYPIFLATKSKILEPPVGQENCEDYELQRKKSTFLKNYHQKLKRQRKRQLKLKSSIKQLKTIKYPMNPNRTINSIQQPAQLHQSSNLPDTTKRSTSILILRKTPFLDTSASIFRQRKDYSKDSTLQLLLKEINEIKMQEKKQIEKLSHQRKKVEQDGKKAKKVVGDNVMRTKENFFTKYERGFLLPMRRKLGMGNGTMSKTSDQLQSLENSFTKYGSGEKIKSYKKGNERGQLEKFYNFKQIDPWENPSQRENNNSFEGGNFLFSTVQN